MSTPNARRFSLWAPVALYMMFIFWLSSISTPPDIPGGVSDKGAHGLLYAGLSALLVRARAGGWWRPVTLGIAVSAVAAATLYGISDEAHQYFVPLRQVDARDVLADGIGAALAAGALYAWSRIDHARRRSAIASEDARERGV